jgi:2-polyprenyl-6-methoxyphenol hydroxylase-like FAD-dependent oxidoreductase
MTSQPAGPVDVLVVGAGPTGLALAAQLVAFGATVRIVDRRPEPGRESRALVVQPRTLEALRPLGVTPALLRRGEKDARVQLHLDGRDLTVPLSAPGLGDTSYPFLLVLRQAETEAALLAHLGGRGLEVEWGTEFLASRSDEAGVDSAVRHADGRHERVRARYLVGCDGAHSTVRRSAGIDFPGASYRRSVLLADATLTEDLAAAAAHVFVGRHGVLGLLAVGEHAPWRILLVRTGQPGRPGEPPAQEVRTMVDILTGGRVRVREVAWTATIPLQRRLAATFRSGRVFVAGDAAHTHSPAAAQGMNTGIQDACNLGWKLALAARDPGAATLLDTYQAERRPVARAVVALTHLAFWVETADNLPVRRARAAVAPLAVPLGLRFAWPRTLAFHAIGQLWVRYPHGPAAVEGQPRLRRGPKAGHRLPDARLRRGQVPCRLHQALATPAFQLLLCGPPEAWDRQQLARFRERYGDLVVLHRLAPHPVPGVLYDPSGDALARLGARNGAQYLVRPDGHVGYRCAGYDLTDLQGHMARWVGGDAVDPEASLAGPWAVGKRRVVRESLGDQRPLCARLPRTSLELERKGDVCDETEDQRSGCDDPGRRHRRPLHRLPDQW